MIERIDERAGLLHQAVAHEGILYVGGIVADDAALDMAGQTRQTLRKLKRILEDNRSGMDRLLSVQVLITDMRLKAEMNAAWKAFFAGRDLPARVTLGVQAIEEGVLIEVVATAAQRQT